MTWAELQEQVQALAERFGIDPSTFIVTCRQSPYRNTPIRHPVAIDIGFGRVELGLP